MSIESGNNQLPFTINKLPFGAHLPGLNIVIHRINDVFIITKY